MIDYFQYLDEALDLYENDSEIQGNITKVAKYLHHKYSLIEDVSLESFRRQLNDRINRKLADTEIVATNVRLKKQKQKLQDTNRIERKSFREQARYENAIEEYAKALLEENREYGKFLKTLNISRLRPTKQKRGVGIIQLTDLHANELINLPHNKFDFEVLSKRMKLYAYKCVKRILSDNVEKVALIITGDLLNSDRRLDEMLNQATNRSKASLLMQHLLIQFILEIRNETGLAITIVSVLGNESRVGKELPFSNEGLSDNYDFNIVGSVKQQLEFARISGINFGSIDKVEQVVNIDGKNWLVAHDLSKYTDKQEKSQQTIGRYSLQGTKIDFMLGGHIHATRVMGNSARSSSMTGSNSYNEVALNLAGKAQHNYYLAQDGRIETTVFDLQDVSKIEGYNIVKELEAYNVKSVDKLYVGQTVFKVVI